MFGLSKSKRMVKFNLTLGTIDPCLHVFWCCLRGRLCVLTFPLWIIKVISTLTVGGWFLPVFGRNNLCQSKKHDVTSAFIKQILFIIMVTSHTRRFVYTYGTTLLAACCCHTASAFSNRQKAGSFMLTVHCKGAAGLSFLQINELAYYFPNCLLAQLTLWGTKQSGMNTVTMIRPSSLVQAYAMLRLCYVFTFRFVSVT